MKFCSEWCVSFANLKMGRFVFVDAPVLSRNVLYSLTIRRSYVQTDRLVTNLSLSRYFIIPVFLSIDLSVKNRIIYVYSILYNNSV